MQFNDDAYPHQSHHYRICVWGEIMRAPVIAMLKYKRTHKI